MAIKSKQGTARKRVDDVIHAFKSGLKLDNSEIDRNSLSFIAAMQLQAQSRAESKAIAHGCYMHVAEQLGDEEAYRKHAKIYKRARRWL